MVRVVQGATEGEGDAGVDSRDVHGPYEVEHGNGRCADVPT